jgi:hypothetical protein
VRRLLDGSGEPGEEVRTTVRTIIDGPPDQVPTRREPLPLIHEDGSGPLDEPRRVGRDHLPDSRVVQAVHGGSPTRCRRSLADAFRTFERDRRKLRQQHVELVVDRAPKVLFHPPKLQLVGHLRYIRSGI